MSPSTVGPAPADADVDVVMPLTYYAPYVSGLTNAGRDVAEGLAARGWRVRVVTTRHDRSLARREVVHGVDVLRSSVVARLGKGVIAPDFVPDVRRASRRAGVLVPQLPLLEAGPAARLSACPVVPMYQCDIALPGGAADAAVQRVMDASSRAAFKASDRVVVSSDDYARHSRVWDAMQGRTLAITPPCHVRPAAEPTFRDGAGLHVGFLGRIVEEKGLEYLVRGFRALPDPDARLLIGGSFADVAGGSVVDRVRAAIGDDPRVRLLGFVADADLPAFYASLDVFALPSVNSFEAFGIVQVEAMMAGVPALASDLPGVRMPVRDTGFGEVVPPRDPAAITAALERLARGGLDRERGARLARERYSVDAVVDRWAEVLAPYRRSRD